MPVSWTKECRPWRSLLCLYIKAAALVLQTRSGIFFLLLDTEDYLHKVAVFFHLFFSLYYSFQLLSVALL